MFVLSGCLTNFNRQFPTKYSRLFVSRVLTYFCREACVCNRVCVYVGCVQEESRCKRESFSPHSGQIASSFLACLAMFHG